MAEQLGEAQGKPRSQTLMVVDPTGKLCLLELAMGPIGCLSFIDLALFLVLMWSFSLVQMAT